MSNNSCVVCGRESDMPRRGAHCCEKCSRGVSTATICVAFGIVMTLLSIIAIVSHWL